MYAKYIKTFAVLKDSVEIKSHNLIFGKNQIYLAFV